MRTFIVLSSQPIREADQTSSAQSTLSSEVSQEFEPASTSLDYQIVYTDTRTQHIFLRFSVPKNKMLIRQARDLIKDEMEKWKINSQK